MRVVPGWILVLTSLAVLIFPALGQPEQTRPAGLPSDANVVAFINRAEEALLSWLGGVTPLAEGYFQESVPADQIGYRLNRDRYVLGRFNGSNGPRMEDLYSDRGLAGRGDSIQPAGTQHLLDGLLQMMAPDWRQLGPDRYEYKFVQISFLGALHCLVYDVRPLHPGDDAFTGRLYVEDKTWNIVRFTGINPQVDALFASLRRKSSKFRLDGWRVNVAKDRWAPAYAYVEEVAPLDAPEQPVVKGHVRFWGYDRSGSQVQETHVDVILNESPSTAESRKDGWAGPARTQRLFEMQAEGNVLARLYESRFIGAPGEVEKMLDQVVMNLVITNKIPGDPVHCRVLLTAPLEAFLVGNTIVLSRELINVLPSESALAMVVAHQLAHSILGHRKVDTKLAFPDVLRISDAELLAKLRFQHSDAEEKAANAKALEILANSPYKGAMEDGGLFMQAIQAQVRQLSALIQPNFGEHLADARHLVQDDPMFRTTPLRDEKLVNQVTAMPLGSKLVLQPWDGHVDFFREEAQRAPVLYERAELGLTPFMPFLDYFSEKSTAPKPAEPVKLPTPRRDGVPARRPVTSAKKGPS
jgi:hypothetical protein